MMTSTAVAFFAGYLFLASSAPVAPPLREQPALTASPMGYTEFCSQQGACDPWGAHDRRTSTRPMLAEPLALPLLKQPAMVAKEHWRVDRIITASRTVDEEPGKPFASRPILLPMLLKEHWFSDRTLAAVAAEPAASPATLRIARDWIDSPPVGLATPFRNTTAPVNTRRAPAAVHPGSTPRRQSAVTFASAPMIVKERWFRTRVFAVARAEPRPSPRYTGGEILPKGGGRHHIGKPYQVAGRWFTPKEDPAYDVHGVASWYGAQFHRRMTSNGEWFDMDHLTAAHPTLPLPSYVKVTNLANGSELIVRVNDRGPFAAGRIIDVSRRCAEALGFKDRGTANVRVQYVGIAPLDDRGSHLRAVNRELRRGTNFDRMLVAADVAVRTLAAVDANPGRAF